MKNKYLIITCPYNSSIRCYRKDATCCFDCRHFKIMLTPEYFLAGIAMVIRLIKLNQEICHKLTTKK